MTRRLLLIAILYPGLCLLAAQDVPVAGVPNCRRVDDHVYRGAQPTDRGLEALAQAGVRTVIDLRGGQEQPGKEKAAVEALGMRYVHVPMKGFEAPADDQVRQVLALLDAREPVFVHCRRGKDRTGTVIACYRIEHDRWSNRKALAEARACGMSSFERDMQRYILRFEADRAR